MTDPLSTRSAPRPLLTRLSASLPLAALALALSAPASAALMISQVYGGGGNVGATYNYDYVELHNSGTAAVSLAGMSLQYGSAGGAAAASSTALSGTVPAGGYFLVRLGTTSNTVGAALPVTPDLLGNTSSNLGGTAGKLALVSGTALLSAFCPANAAGTVDFVGYGTNASCGEGSTLAPAPSNTTAIFRASVGNSCQDTNSNSTDFSVAAPNPRNTASAAQPCGGTGGGGGGGGLATARKIYEIQGSGSTSPYAAQNVITSGVVTKVNSNGFFMQDPSGDGNPLTSDGIFVFTGSSAYAAVAVGNLIEVTGTVVEFNVGSSADTAAHTVTEISPVSTITLTSTGNTIAPTVVTLPEAVNDDLERYEGMLVTINGPFTVGQNYFQGRYGQITLSVGGRMQNPTNAFRPGTAAYLALADQNKRSTLILDDGSSQQNPNPTPYLATGLDRAGNTIATLTGVIDYGLATSSSSGAGDYKIHPTIPPTFVATNPRTTTPPPVGGNVKLGSFNVLNFFTTFTNGDTADGQTGQGCTLGTDPPNKSFCRGADSLAEFLRQRAKIVEAIAAINADAYGLMEIQNNGIVAVQNLVDALNAKLGAGTYAAVADPASGMGDDAIKTAIIYKPSRLTTFGAALSDTAAINNRPTLAQTFRMANGEKFTLMVNHLKSKSGCGSGADADAGDGQGCYNGTRLAQAQRLRTFVTQVQLSSGARDVLLVGDFNAYAKEDPVNELTSHGYIDLIGAFNAFSYSYVFDGAAGYLDHAISTAEMSNKVAFATHWHINADESLVYDYNVEFKAPLTTCGGPCPADPYAVDPYRSSDHEPVVLGLMIYKTMLGTTRADTITGTPGDDYIWGGGGADVLTGNGGNNVFGYYSLKDAGDTITDFVPGKDRLDLRLVLADLRYTGNDAVADGHVRFVSVAGGTAVQVGPGTFRTLVTLTGVSPASLSSLRELIIR